jgi:glucose/arabinose dehydrogenase
MKVAKTAVLAALAATGASAQTNLGAQKPQASLPFVMTQVATFNLPWRLAFLPDGRMLITEKVGPIWLVTQTGEKTPVANVPPVLAQGQGGMLGVFLSPHYAEDHFVYLTYSEPGDGGSSLALARAKLTLGQGSASLDDLKVIWRDGERGKGGQFGAPDSQPSGYRTSRVIQFILASSTAPAIGVGLLVAPEVLEPGRRQFRKRTVC